MAPLTRPLLLFSIAAALAACSTAAEQQKNLGSAEERQMTVGVVQKEIRAGMTQGQVAEALGSPNIVNRGINGRETWIYDKVATEASYSNSGAYGTVLLLGGGSAAGASSSTQKTLTVVIRFDATDRVETFSYHSSKF